MDKYYIFHILFVDYPFIHATHVIKLSQESSTEIDIFRPNIRTGPSIALHAQTHTPGDMT